MQLILIEVELNMKNRCRKNEHMISAPTAKHLNIVPSPYEANSIQMSI